VAVLGIVVAGSASFLLAWNEEKPAAVAAAGMVLRLRVSLGTELDVLLKEVLAGGTFRLLSLGTAKQGTSLDAAYEVHLGKDLSPEELVKRLHRMDGIHDVRLTVRGAEAE
jgi:hypothetical protein